MSFIDKFLDSRIWVKFMSFNWWQKLLSLFGMLLTIMLIFDFLLLPFYTRHGAEYQLPDVTEKSQIAATDILSNNGFLPIVQDSVFDATYPKGTVVRQNPSPYATVKKGRRVYLVVSDGEKPIYMPYLIKESLTNSELILKESGLQLGNTYWAYSRSLPYRGVVIRQSIPSGDLVKAGQTVNLTVSLGPPPSSQEMPNVVGKSLEAALKEIEAVGVSVNNISIKSRYRPNLVPATIISQSVGSGTAVQDIKALTLVVSTDRIPQDSRER